MGRPKLETPNYRLVQRGQRYHVQWWQDGKPRSVSTGQTDKRQASVWLNQFVAGQGTPEPPAAPTLSQVLDGYLADRKQAVIGYETLVTNAKALKRQLGDLEPDHLTTERMRFYRSRRRAEGHEVGPADNRRKKPIQDGTILRELVTLRAALKWAQNQKWIVTAPHIEVPSQPPPRERWLTRDEADRLLASAQAPHVRTFLAICLYTAARAQAVMDLTWNRINSDAGIIDLGSASGGKARSVVPITAKLRPYLEEARRAATCAYVIEHAGKPVASVKTGTRAAARRAGLPGVTPHVLRHTAATWMAMERVPMEQIARMLGHSDTRITWRTYAKYSPDYLRDAADALSGYGSVSESVA
jgi:integrase